MSLCLLNTCLLMGLEWNQQAVQGTCVLSGELENDLQTPKS